MWQGFWICHLRSATAQDQKNKGSKITHKKDWHSSSSKLFLLTLIMIFFFNWVFEKCNSFLKIIFKNTHRESALSNKTPTFSKTINMDILVGGTSNQFFTQGS